MFKVYTIGYSGKSVAQVADLLVAFNAMLVDIRFVAYSKNLDWQRDTLRTVFGSRYLWVKALGNVNYKNGGPIKLWLPQKGVTQLKPVLEKMPIILLCGCRDWQTCHRSEASELLAQELGAQVKHLEAGAA
jgi:uncharacterized protein (DUF488 family)